MKQSPDRALKSTEGTVVPGQGFYNAFKCESFQLPVVTDELTFSVSEAAHADHDEVNQSPDSAASCCKKHNDTCAGLTYIESMDSKAARKEAEEKSY